MRTTLVTAITIAFGLSAAPVLIASSHAEGTETPAPQGKSITQAAGQLKTDSSQTTKDAQALDIDKTTKGAGQVKQDAKDLHQSAKDTMKNPLGTTAK